MLVCIGISVGRTSPEEKAVGSFSAWFPIFSWIFGKHIVTLAVNQKAFVTQEALSHQIMGAHTTFLSRIHGLKTWKGCFRLFARLPMGLPMGLPMVVDNSRSLRMLRRISCKKMKKNHQKQNFFLQIQKKSFIIFHISVPHEEKDANRSKK